MFAQVVRRAEPGDPEGQCPHHVGNEDGIATADEAMALRLANGFGNLASSGVCLLHEFWIRAPVLQKPAKHRRVVRRIGGGKVDVRRSHHLERIVGGCRGIRANPLQRLSQQPESVSGNFCDQRCLVIEMTVERGPRDADFGADTSERETFHTFGRDDLDRRGDERPFEITMVISPPFSG